MSDSRSSLAGGGSGRSSSSSSSSLGLPEDVETRLAALTPQTYVGLAPELVGYLDEA